MSRSVSRSILLGILALVCASSASAASSDGGLTSLTSSVIGGNCGPTTTAFGAWGDSHSYYFTASGGFESGAPGWSLGGAQVVPGNEPFYLHSQSDNSSLLIPAGATATSPLLCFGALTPGIRFLAISPSGPATLHVRVIARGLLSSLAVLDGGTLNVGTTWAPTNVLSTTFSQLNVPVGTKSIQLQFTSSAPVQIDDIYIDPFVSH